MKVGIVGGSNMRSTSLVREAEARSVQTPYGNVNYYQKNNTVFILRHGSESNRPPHMINHRANLWALKEADAGAIIGLCMVGSLKKGMRPPCLLVPDDYIGLWSVPTFYDDRIVHITPSLDEGIRKLILSAARGDRLKLHEKGVYIQTHGPRLETRAEVRMLARFGDVVGMTMASEATLAQEANLKYAALCVVDNYAHGIGDEGLDFRDIIAGDAARKGRDAAQKIIMRLAGEDAR